MHNATFNWQSWTDKWYNWSRVQHEVMDKRCGLLLLEGGVLHVGKRWITSKLGKLGWDGQNFVMYVMPVCVRYWFIWGIGYLNYLQCAKLLIISTVLMFVHVRLLHLESHVLSRDMLRFIYVIAPLFHHYVTIDRH